MKKIDYSSSQKLPFLDFKAPLAMDFWISGQCNMRCRYCLHGLDERDALRKDIVPGLMTWETFQRIADGLREFPVPVISADFCGIGEPTLHPRLEDMIACLRGQGLVRFVELSTNGLLLTKERAKRLLDSGLNMLSVSVQGVDEDGYQRLCGVKADPNRIAETLAWIQAYKKHDVFVVVRTVDLALRGEDDEKTFHALFDHVADQTLVANAVRLYKGMDYSELIPVPKDQFGRESITYSPACPLVFSTMHARPNGDIAVCPLPVCPEILGNIADHTLPELWNSERRLRLLLTHALCHREECEACDGCTQPDMLAAGSVPPPWLAERIRRQLELNISEKMRKQSKKLLYNSN